jgi:hypothetical protein
MMYLLQFFNLIRFLCFRSIVLVLTDSSIETYLDNLETSQEKIQKITFVDCYQNHLEWDSQTENQQQKHEYKYQHCSLVNVENLFSKLFSKTETGSQTNSFLFFSLSLSTHFFL